MGHHIKVGMLFAILMATSACEKQATGQSVAVVNGEEISEGELNTELQLANVPESADKKVVMPQLLQRVIDRRLIAQKAVEAGVDRSPEYVSRQRRMNEQLLISLYGERQADQMKAPDAAATKKFIAENPNMFTQREVLQLDQLRFARPADMTILQQLRDDHSLGEVAATLQQLGIPFERGRNQVDTGTLAPEAIKQLNALPAGEPFVVPQGGNIVVSVISGRQALNVPQEAAQKIAAEAMRRQRLQESMEKQLKDARAAAKIEYKEGFAPKEGTGAAGAEKAKAPAAAK